MHQSHSGLAGMACQPCAAVDMHGFEGRSARLYIQTDGVDYTAGAADDSGHGLFVTDVDGLHPISASEPRIAGATGRRAAIRTG